MKRHAWKHGPYARDRENQRSPKRWARPRSYRWRDEQWPAPTLASVGGAVAILKYLYSPKPQPIFDRPEWAKVALKFGWMTRRQFGTVPTFNTGRMTPGITEAMYMSSAVLGLRPKQ